MNYTHFIWAFSVVCITSFLVWYFSSTSSNKKLNNYDLSSVQQKQPEHLHQTETENETKDTIELPRFVYLEVSQENYMRMPRTGKVVIELFVDIVPKTSYNFIWLCENKKYNGSSFHRVIKDFMVQGGDFINGNGTGSLSAYGNSFEDENFVLKHSESGLLSMANSGPNTNGCQFFILTKPAHHLDGKHVVFGRVVSGMEYISELENEMTDSQDKPLRKWTIVDCGVIGNQLTPNLNENGLTSEISPLIKDELDTWVSSFPETISDISSNYTTRKPNN